MKQDSQIRGVLKPIVIFSLPGVIVVSSVLVGLVTIGLLHRISGPGVPIKKCANVTETYRIR